MSGDAIGRGRTATLLWPRLAPTPKALMPCLAASEVELTIVFFSPPGVTVMSRAERFDSAFIERKREQLTQLRKELLSLTAAKETEETDINTRSSGEAREYEDDGQRLTILDNDGDLIAHDIGRVAVIDRALQKIEEGTYGFSDLSGDPIPTERLEATPDAIYTVAEQEAREGTSVLRTNANRKSD
jgi:DnaK suppressor protein